MTEQEQRRRYRFEREYARMAYMAPFLNRLRQPRNMLLRLLVGVCLIIGGFLAVLPVFGLWMIPLGLFVLAIDIPALQAPLASMVVRARWWWHRKRARWFGGADRQDDSAGPPSV